MRKTFIAILLLLLASGAAFAQYIVNFEGADETKTAYASGTVNLTGLDWNMTESLIGNASSDFYNGTKSARFSGKANSSITMLADKANGIGTLSFQYRRYGSDAQVAWKAEYSINQGSTWTQIGSAFTATESVQTFSSEINVTGNIRIRILLVDNIGTTYKRMNVDDITITDYTGGAPTPTIGVSGTLTPFSAYTGTPSDAQSYTVSGSNLTANIAVVAPTGYALSTDQTTWTATLSLASTFNGLVYVRMTGATAGEFNGNITHNSTGAAEVTQAVSGSVSDPIPQIFTTGTPTAFSTLVGTPSASQQYNLTAAFLTANITITAPAGFEISTDGSNYSAGLSVAPNYNGQIYVRLTGTTVGTYDGNILHSSTGATDVNVAVSGTVTEPLGPTTFFEENFPYTAGTALTANGWTAHSAGGTNAILVTEPGMTYPGYPLASGLAATITTSGEDINKTFTPIATEGSVYTSLLVNVSSAQTTGDYFYHLCSSPINSSFHRGRVFIQKDTASDNFRFGLANAGGIATAVSTGYDYVYGTTYLLVLKYDILPGTNNDVVHLWINPVISATEPTPTLTSTDVITSEPAGIGSVILRQGTAANAPALRVDGIRVTNDWALLWDGTPPPPPALAANPTILDPLTSVVGNYSDEFGSYTITSSNLLGQINVVASEGFVVSTDQTNWSSTLDLAVNFTGTIYVSMYASISGEYNGNIVHTTAGLDPVNVAVSGEAFNPAVIWNITANLTAFSAEAGTPSAPQSYTLSASNASQNLALETTAPFEISTSETAGFGSSLNLDYDFNGTVWVRMNPVTAGEFSGNITHTTTNASPYELALSGTATAPPGNYAIDIFFSEYIEGSSNNKAIEIFNGTGLPVDLSDYRFENWFNGGSSHNDVAMSGTLNHGEVYVMAHTLASAAIRAIADITNANVNFNGDDALVLRKISTDAIIDIFGVVGQDPGTMWTGPDTYQTLDRTLVRKPTVTQGVTVNPTISVPAVTTDFVTLATEWDVYGVDTITYLGSHTFTPGASLVENPVFSPTPGLYTSPINVEITTTTSDASIYYTTNGTDPTTESTLYTGAIPVSASTTIRAKAYKTGWVPSAVVQAVYSFPVPIADIATLRGSAQGATIYQLTGEAILTFQQGATRYTKYIQDATAAIVIDDPAHIITTTYNLYDGITGITGTLGLYNGLLQFTPVANPAAATSTGNVVVPELRTLASLTSDDQGKLVKIENVMVDATLVTFGSYAQNINATDPTATLVLRTFASTDYSGTPIPTVAQDIICLVGEFNTTMQISPRFLADFSNHSAGQLETPVVTISVVGSTISLNWDAITGASTYLVEGAADPYGTYTTIEPVNTNTWSGAAEGMKFFKVTAQP